MWVKRAEYLMLVEKAARMETRADWLLTRVNQLEHDCGLLRLEITGKPQPVPMYQKEATPPPDPPAETSFEDMGDVAALQHGVNWDDAGRVVFSTAS